MTDYSFTSEELEAAKVAIREGIEAAFDRRLWEAEVFSRTVLRLEPFGKSQGQRYVVTMMAVETMIKRNEIRDVSGRPTATGRRLFALVNVLDRIAKSV